MNKFSWLQECFLCKAHISLVQTVTNKCKCNNVFCITHKIPENHACTFNFRAAHASHLTSNMPLVQKSKIEHF
jgi:predicted nucleic acid binding AN1-type Zn finger protein